MRPWIINPLHDRVFIVGGVLASVLLTVGVLTSGTVGIWWWIWILALDGPHVFATLARTYLDPEEATSSFHLPFGRVP